MPSKMWDEITYPFPNFNGYTVEWISNFIPLFIVDVLTYPCSWHWSQSMLVNEAPVVKIGLTCFYHCPSRVAGVNKDSIFCLCFFYIWIKPENSSATKLRCEGFHRIYQNISTKVYNSYPKQKLSNLAPAASSIQRGCPWNKKNIHFLGIQHWTPRLNGALNQIRCERIALHQVRSGKCQTDSGFLITPATARQSPEPIFVHRSYVINLIPCTKYITYSFEKYLFCKCCLVQNLFFSLWMWRFYCN